MYSRTPDDSRRGAPPPPKVKGSRNIVPLRKSAPAKKGPDPVLIESNKKWRHKMGAITNVKCQEISEEFAVAYNDQEGKMWFTCIGQAGMYSDLEKYEILARTWAKEKGFCELTPTNKDHLLSQKFSAVCNRNTRSQRAASQAIIVP